jgi:hypothetical protein
MSAFRVQSFSNRCPIDTRSRLRSSEFMEFKRKRIYRFTSELLLL